MFLYEVYMVSGGIIKQQPFNIAHYIVSQAEKAFEHINTQLLPLAISIWQY